MGGKEAPIFRPKLIAFVLWLVTLAVPVFPGETVILTTHDQKPLTFLTESGTVEGTAVAPVEFALKSLGVDYKLEILPWVRAQESVRAGRAAGFFAATRNQERDSYAVATEPIAHQTTNWYLLKNNPMDPRSEPFRTNARVAGYAGSNMLKDLKTGDYMVVGEPSDPDQLFLMLAAGRFDACLANDFNYSNFLSGHPDYAGKFRIVVRNFEPLYVYWSRTFLAGHPGFLRRFNSALEEYNALTR